MTLCHILLTNNSIQHYSFAISQMVPGILLYNTNNPIFTPRYTVSSLSIKQESFYFVLIIC